MRFEYRIYSSDGAPLTGGEINAESEDEAYEYAEGQCFGDLKDFHISVNCLD
jgi:hypothetical protein